MSLIKYAILPGLLSESHATKAKCTISQHVGGKMV